MRSTTSYSRGDVVVVPFPFTDLSGRKKRPAVVISSDSYNRATRDLILAQITGNVNGRPRFGDHYITGWQEAGLKMPSLVRTKLVTLEASRIIMALGRMPPNDMQGIESGLRAAMQL